jgi:mannose-6-phosphate isomerase-like protein (cupin superfamily)
MRYLLAAIFLLTTGVCVTSQTAVTIEQDPSHRLKFENKFIRVFNVEVPVGGSTLFHSHIFDGVGVRITNAEIVDEVLGGEKATYVMKPGEVSFGARPSPLSHRVINSGKGIFRNIFIEILPSNAVPPADTVPPLSPQHTVAIQNARIRANRLILKPGSSTVSHLHPRHGIGVAVADGKAQITAADGSSRIVDLRAGDFVWQEAGTRHMIKNVGKAPLELIDIELW